ncbi:CRISPR-associated endonuclease Cas2 [Acidithiobacillus caldus]|jgi:CRISPR-associated endonuclease Cas2|uniref:CRISPR-associated endoribonuclease Cas2 n=1 Tax=Acidithiobacillus caldus TaxID=33059 RepID=A0A1E7YKT3_9PROT|nr:CRISPR-associated endonuclease Cas2 [Acidithiobacillus caldus]OFC30731.1 CRISPR-associated endonuclease Cas2 [Acidithiobacillus caldus]OFC32021.1 CRISPR-associated endonuclease Cas2 [Acidithiobacillus caldus]OFC36660.1 CRISPR-associated endonuclease Cas2 [Acidithiobacillus caldus]
MSASRILLAYDITRPTRATRARKSVRSYLDGLQRSVYTGLATPPTQRALLESLEGVLDPQDRWLIAILDPRAQRLSLGAITNRDDTFAYWGG